MSDVIGRIKTNFGENTVLEGDQISNRATSYWDPTPISAKAIIRPSSTEETSNILSMLNEEGQIVVTHGGLTGCAMAANTTPDHVALSLEKMNKIIEIDEIGGTITLEAGAILENVQNAVAEKRFYFPLDLGARGSCTVGGNAATNAGGINVIRYGMMRNHILGMEAVLADGTILSSMNKVIKNNSGYDLKQLFIGTEGTLGVITKLIVKLETAPKSLETAMASLSSFEKVTDFLNLMKKETASRLTAFEVMWGKYYDAVTGPDGHKPPMNRNASYYVITECSGSDPESDQAIFMNALEKAIEQGIIDDAIISKSEKERKAIWTVREGFEPILENKPIFLYDISLPIPKMDDYIQNIEKELLSEWNDADIYVIGHIGDGNLHLFICPNQGDETLHHKSNEIIYGHLRKIGGAVSAEHGIGLEKKEWLSYCRSDAEISLMRLLKRTLDPKNILNPGVIFDLDNF
ncbi:FAD-binding oxidoreductase [Pseudemcibacter aquimaris]|uniref:FAD-binding oxidoreductase n=1 Tax=Pseudemcibacter aquimaris TaxID=2857064 RepID=UPI0020137B8F|nr:FAD-binding oxidoreductase [Pseudemcibacter aquimaris]MCC3861505.1 FAD-binding oxidoreductase [Pseudemcibacter aquimaris]WDU58274.1 FAD-binding oxidoreductase [Pseudemcibacter aquimaris]